MTRPFVLSATSVKEKRTQCSPANRATSAGAALCSKAHDGWKHVLQPGWWNRFGVHSSARTRQPSLHPHPTTLSRIGCLPGEQHLASRSPSLSQKQQPCSRGSAERHRALVGLSNATVSVDLTKGGLSMLGSSINGHVPLLLVLRRQLPPRLPQALLRCDRPHALVCAGRSAPGAVRRPRRLRRHQGGGGVGCASE